MLGGVQGCRGGTRFLTTSEEDDVGFFMARDSKIESVDVSKKGVWAFNPLNWFGD